MDRHPVFCHLAEAIGEHDELGGETMRRVEERGFETMAFGATESRDERAKLLERGERVLDEVLEELFLRDGRRGRVRECDDGRPAPGVISLEGLEVTEEVTRSEEIDEDLAAGGRRP